MMQLNVVDRCNLTQGNPNAKVLATFHATEIWAEDINFANRWLPPKCLVRNADGSPCSWWVGLVFTNNLLIPECFEAAVANAMRALDGGLVAAGVDGVFLGAHYRFLTSMFLLTPPTPASAVLTALQS